MGISNVMAHWFERLHHNGVFTGKASILEVGRQDIVLSKNVLVNFVTSVSRAPLPPTEIVEKFFLNGQPRWWTSTPDFYATLGLRDYHAADLDDQRADFPIDLNLPISLNRRFDVITDFGTIEHVFNIANIVKFIHDHLELGGVALHVLPTRGDYNHGFFNIHSTFYRDLAVANRYEIVDLVNVPDFAGQCESVEASEKIGDSRPRKSNMVDIANTDDPGREVEFAKLVVERAETSTRTYDYVFAALRKRVDAEFVCPQQFIYTEAGSRGFSVNGNRAKKPRRFGAHLGAAFAYLQAGRWSEAEASAQAALDVIPDSADALHVLGIVLAQTGRPVDAVAALRKACEFSPENAQARKNLGVVLRSLGHIGDAIACFRQTTALAPGMADGHFHLGTALQEAGNVAGAMNIYRRVLSLDPDHAAAKAALATAIRP